MRVCAGPAPIGRAPPVPMMSCGWNAPRGGPRPAQRPRIPPLGGPARAVPGSARRGSPARRAAPPALGRLRAPAPRPARSRRAEKARAGCPVPGLPARAGAARATLRIAAPHTGPPGTDSSSVHASFPSGAAKGSAVPGRRRAHPCAPPPRGAGGTPPAARGGGAPRPVAPRPVPPRRPGADKARRAPRRPYLVLDLGGEPVGGPLVEVGHVGGLPRSGGADRRRWRLLAETRVRPRPRKVLVPPLRPEPRRANRGAGPGQPPRRAGEGARGRGEGRPPRSGPPRCRRRAPPGGPAGAGSAAERGDVSGKESAGTEGCRRGMRRRGLLRPAAAPGKGRGISARDRRPRSGAARLLPGASRSAAKCRTRWAAPAAPGRREHGGGSACLRGYACPRAFPGRTGTGRRRGGLGEPGRSATGRGQGWMLGKPSAAHANRSLTLCRGWATCEISLKVIVCETWNNSGRRSKREERGAQLSQWDVAGRRAHARLDLSSSAPPCAPGHGSHGKQHLRSLYGSPPSSPRRSGTKGQRCAVLVAAGSRGSPVPLRKAQGTHEVCVLGIPAGLPRIQPVPGSQRWTAAGIGTEATLESEYTVNTWSIEWSPDPKIQHWFLQC